VRVGFDTNVFVSALALPGGTAERAIVAAADGRAKLLLSRPIVHEVLEVLGRKFDKDPEELARVAVFLADLGRMVHPRIRVRELDDDPDNRILECAVAGGADFIVTGDRAMLALGSFRTVRIVSLREFLSIVTAGPSAA
jgi:putative PIN family toxin of toxin-antitoxin system